jgi:hypothetical protein
MCGGAGMLFVVNLLMKKYILGLNKTQFLENKFNYASALLNSASQKIN